MMNDSMPSNGAGALGNYQAPHLVQRTSTTVHTGQPSGSGNPSNALLTQTNMSHSALVNTGNAAILGNLNGLNLNSNNNNLMNANTNQAREYGTGQNVHGGNGASQISRDNIFADMQMPSGGAHLLGAQRQIAGGVGHSDQLKFTGAASVGT